MLKFPKVSFCITCKNRFYQIKKTLPKNLFDNAIFKSMVEFVLVDFDSNDGLHEWVLKQFTKELNEGYLKFYYTCELPFWHASVAKNTAHLYASNDILVNLDCDNYTGKWGGKFVLKNFIDSENRIILHQFAGSNFDGTFGRISLFKEDFLLLGGYDESFEPMGHQDTDLIKRSNSIGLQYRHRPDTAYSTAIRNSLEESIKYCNTQLNYFQMRGKNEQKSIENLKKGIFKSNGDTFGIRKNVFDHKGKEIIIPDFDNYRKIK